MLCAYKSKSRRPVNQKLRIRNSEIRKMEIGKTGRKKQGE